MPNSAFYEPAFLALALSGLVSACGGDSTAPNRPAEVVVTAVDTLRSVGASAALTAVVRNASHQEIPGAVVSSWESSNQSVVTVNATTGLATAVANGAATITAHAGTVSGSTKVVVLQAPVSVAIVPPTDTLRSLGATGQYTATVKDAGGSVIAAPGVSWSSTNAAVVTFDVNGLATAVSNGSVYVQARVGGVVDSVLLAVHQRIDPTKSTISVVRPLLFVGDTVRATLQTRDALNHPLGFGGAAIVFSSQGGTSAGTFRSVVDSQDGTYSADFVGASLGTALTITASIDGAPVTSSLPTMRVVGFTRIAAAGANLLTGGQTTTGGYTCGIITTSDMYCWGVSWFGVLGNGSFGSLSPGPTPTLVAGGHQWTDVAAGMYYVCAVASGGSVFCWGGGGAGELGNGNIGHGSADNVAIPTPISGGGTFSSVSIGSVGGACAITLTKAAWCWGDGVDGRLGNGTETPTAIPVAVSGGLSFDALATTSAGTCGIVAGAAYCWGYSGMLGLDGPAPDTCSGSTPCAKTPLAVSGGLVFRPVVSIDGNVACAIATDGQAYCWGTGYIGTGTVGTSSTPTAVAGGLSFATLEAGENFHCGTVVGGVGYCWGANPTGNLGNGTMIAAVGPTPVSGGHSFTQLASSQVHTCGITTDGNAYCWGGNDMGELGTRTTTPSTTPVRVKLFAP
jgi:alpha-tubulin suppressor-like RCC1 family protein